MTDVQVSWTKFLVRVSRTRNLDRLSGALDLTDEELDLAWLAVWGVT